MKPYNIEPLGVLRILILDITAEFSGGLLPNLEAIDGVISIFEEVWLSDTHYTIHLSSRVDWEDIAMIKQAIVDVCDIQVKNCGGTVAH